MLIAVALLAASCSRGSGTPAQAHETASPRIRVEYRKPAHPEHERFYTAMRDQRLLDHLAECLSAVPVPRTLTLAFASCDGDSNAYYDERTATVTFCYEYLADIYEAAKSRAGHAIPLRDAIEGPVTFVLLHETGHAVFDLLKVPILGRPEDAADAFAAVHLLRMEKERAIRLIEGAAWAYAQGSRELDESDFSDTHSLDSQRYYNILCLAYGSDPQYFRSAVTGAKLPAQRLGECPYEYRQVSYAIEKLIAPSISHTHGDPAHAEHAAHWGHSGHPEK